MAGLGLALSRTLRSGLRAQRLRRNANDIQWHGPVVMNNIQAGMRTRIKLAATLLRSRVVINLSTPVTKIRRKGKSSIVDPDSRSSPGEYPRADTTLLMKTIFWQMRGDLDAMVATPLDYGLILETRMQRSFLVRTLHESREMIQNILLQGPPLPGQNQ